MTTEIKTIPRPLPECWSAYTEPTNFGGFYARCINPGCNRALLGETWGATEEIAMRLLTFYMQTKF